MVVVLTQQIQKKEGNSMNAKTIRAKELMGILGIGRSKVYELIHSEGFYPAFKIGRKILINVDKLNQWLEEQSMTLYSEKK